MSFDKAAYMREWRLKRAGEGRCPNCGLAMAPATTSTKCRECRAVDKAKEKRSRRYRHLGRAVEPLLRDAMARGEFTRISPSQALKLVQILDMPRAP